MIFDTDNVMTLEEVKAADDMIAARTVHDMKTLYGWVASGKWAESPDLFRDVCNDIQSCGEELDSSRRKLRAREYALKLDGEKG